MNFSGSDVISLVGLLAAVVALLISMQGLRLADKAARNDVMSQVRDWGEKVIEALAEADRLCRLDPARMAQSELFHERLKLISRLSALWDMGRCFFPHTDPDSLGVGELPASRGKRPQILDLLALAHGLAVHIDYQAGAERKKRGLAFVRLRRAFVSTIQDATSFSAPSTVEAYELHLSRIAVTPLPQEIRELANAMDKGFEVRFDASSALV